MEQKDYVLEIVKFLTNGGNHVRGLARGLGTNPMMVGRKIKYLVENNVVDLELRGRNNFYFLKSTPEARAFVLMSEEYSLVLFLKEHLFLREIIEKIQKDKRVKMAFVFGSYVKNLNKKGSDIDFFLVTNNLSVKKEFESLDSRFSVKIGEYDLENNLVKEIDRAHVLIKGGEFYYEKIFG